MKIESRRVWVVPCPKCRRPINFSEDGDIYFKNKEEAEVWANCQLVTSGEKTLTGLCTNVRHGGRRLYHED